MQGLELSTIASSDDHRAHPGQPQYGLAAVAATALTRQAIFQGLYDRRTYGTTGTRILLDFRINDQPMGRHLVTSGLPRFHIEAHGTDTIELVEVLRYSKSESGFRVLVTVHPEASDFLWSGEDATFREDSIYYMRLRQAGLVRNRIVMAWSSPIWVNKS